jgi:hypothetical protein
VLKMSVSFLVSAKIQFIGEWGKEKIKGCQDKKKAVTLSGVEV